MKSSFQAAVLLSSIFLSSCVFAIGTDANDEDTAQWVEADHMNGHGMTAAEEPMAKASKADKKPSKKIDTEGMKFDLMMAELDLVAAHASVGRSLESADHAIAKAERDLALAKDELKHYGAVTMAIAAAESELSLDRTRGRLDDSKAELQQLVDMYADEEFAMSTKELVLTRGKRGVEQSERSLKLAERKAEDKRAFESARKHDSLSFKVAEAERGLKLKVEALATAELEGKSKLMRAENKVQKAKKKFDDAISSKEGAN